MGMSQLEMIQSHQMENGSVNVVEVGSILDGMEANFIGGTVDCARLDTAPGEPHREAGGVMVPSPAPFLADGCAAKLASPNHQGVFQEPTPFEIGEQCSHRAVGCAGHPLVVCVDIIMRIPLPG